MKKEELIQMLIDREIDKGFDCRFDSNALSALYSKFENDYAPKDKLINFEFALNELTFEHSKNGFIVGFETAIELLSTLKEI